MLVDSPVINVIPMLGPQCRDTNRECPKFTYVTWGCKGQVSEYITNYHHIYYT